MFKVDLRKIALLMAVIMTFTVVLSSMPTHVFAANAAPLPPAVRAFVSTIGEVYTIGEIITYRKC